MSRTNADSVDPCVDLLAADSRCPKCGAETEPIDIGTQGLRLEQLQLCPACYLVTWMDHEGFHVRQGAPVKQEDVSGDGPVPLFYACERRPSSC